jgi:hypothetical protein
MAWDDVPILRQLNKGLAVKRSTSTNPNLADSQGAPEIELPPAHIT